MGVCKIKAVSFVSDSEVLVTFVTLGGEDPTRNISEMHKTL
jgi:hypothetical protein